jgi:hypothetical protein
MAKCPNIKNPCIRRVKCLGSASGFAKAHPVFTREALMKAAVLDQHSSQITVYRDVQCIEPRAGAGRWNRSMKLLLTLKTASAFAPY